MAIPAIDARLLELFPPKPRLKAGRLIGQALDSEAAFTSLIKRGETLHEEIGQLRLLQRQSIERARELGDDVQDAAAPFNEAINDLESEL
jgi:hypothetical protein